jgi:hypothetical protein
MTTYKIRCSEWKGTIFLSMNGIYVDGLDCPHLEQRLALERLKDDPSVCLVCNQMKLQFKDQEGKEPTTDMSLYEIVPVDCEHNGSTVFLMRNRDNGHVHGIRCDQYNPGTAKPCEAGRAFPNCIQESRELQKIKL